jgi:putative transposase
MYQWRKMTESERRSALQLRQARKLPWHTPPHLDFEVAKQYLVSASCYEHVPILGKDAGRMTDSESDVLNICRNFCSKIYAWCILPNHYHVLLKTERIRELRKSIGNYNGRSSFKWNGEDERRGRKVWYNCFERPMKSERHFFATLNYVHHNPVHHGYVKHWQDWPWSSAREFLEKHGKEKTEMIWRRYPILDYGRKWDK